MPSDQVLTDHSGKQMSDSGRRFDFFFNVVTSAEEGVTDRLEATFLIMLTASLMKDDPTTEGGFQVSTCDGFGVF